MYTAGVLIEKILEKLDEEHLKYLKMISGLYFHSQRYKYDKSDKDSKMYYAGCYTGEIHGYLKALESIGVIDSMEEHDLGEYFIKEDRSDKYHLIESE